MRLWRNVEQLASPEWDDAPVCECGRRLTRDNETNMLYRAALKPKLRANMQ